MLVLREASCMSVERYKVSHLYTGLVIPILNWLKILFPAREYRYHDTKLWGSNKFIIRK